MKGGISREEEGRFKTRLRRNAWCWVEKRKAQIGRRYECGKKGSLAWEASDTHQITHNVRDIREGDGEKVERSVEEKGVPERCWCAPVLLKTLCQQQHEDYDFVEEHTAPNCRDAVGAVAQDEHGEYGIDE